MQAVLRIFYIAIHSNLPQYLYVMGLNFTFEMHEKLGNIVQNFLGQTSQNQNSVSVRSHIIFYAFLGNGLFFISIAQSIEKV